jgi:hypothetical protein
MKPITTNYGFALLLLLSLIACNQSSTPSEKNKEDSGTVADNSTPSVPVYDPTMDAVNTGGNAVKLLRDTLGVKMYEFTAKPGETAKLHTHPDHLVYILEGGTVELFIKEAGKLDTITFPTGMALISGPLSDSGRNIGNTTIKMLVADIYRPRSK